MYPSCSTSFPAGNLVDGLPPAAHTGEGIEAQQPARYKILNLFATFDELVLRCLLVELHKTSHTSLY